MRQIIQDRRSGAIEVADLPDARAAGTQLLVRTTWSLISPGTESAVAKTAGRSVVAKALDRPDQARMVVEKAVTDGPSATWAAVRARLSGVQMPGYSLAGVVEAVGDDVQGFAPGDRVACVGQDTASHAELVAVPAPLCFRLPDGLEDRWGSFAALGAIAAHGVRVAEVAAGATVAVIGLGLVGQLAAQLATAAGGRVVGIDVSPERVALGLRLGAVAGAVLDRDDPVEAVVAASGGHGADAVIVAAATADDGPIQLAADVARDRAVVSVVGDVGLNVPRTPFFAKELTLRVSRSYGPGRYDSEYEEEGRDYPIGYVRWTERRLIAYFLEEVAAGRIGLEELVSHEFDIGRGEEAYAALSTPHRMAILLRYPAERRPPVVRATVPGTRRAIRSGRLRIGLIGPGQFARATLLPLISRLDVELVGVAARTGATAFASAREHSAAYAATDPQELIDDDGIDALVIATRHASHPDLTVQALQRGKAVFLEKPLAIDEAGLERVTRALDGDARLVVDFNRDFAPTTEQVRRHLSGRAEPVLVDYRVNAGRLDAGHWLRRLDDGGGRLVGEGCHFVELCSSLVAVPLESVQVASLGVTSRTLAGDNFSLLLRYADGSMATIRHVATGTARMPKERVEILGAGRAASIEDFRRAKLYTSAPSLRLARPPAQDKGHAALLERSMRFFRAGGAPPVAYDRLVETTRATLLGRAALAAGETGPVPLAPA